MMLKFGEKFLRFLSKKRPTIIKFSKLSSKSSHRDTDRRFCSNFIKSGRTGNRALFSGQEDKICHGQPLTVYSESPDLIQIGLLLPEL